MYVCMFVCMYLCIYADCLLTFVIQYCHLFTVCVLTRITSTFRSNPLCSWTILSLIASWRLSVEVQFVLP